MPNGDGDGKKTIEEIAKEKTFKGATIRLEELQRQDGLIAESIDKAAIHSLGVIQTVITATPDDKDYRQILKRAVWKDREEMDKAVNALAVCDITGAVNAKRIILDRITAHSAGIDGYILHQALEALTHTTFTSHEYLDKKKKRAGNGYGSNSPISG